LDVFVKKGKSMRNRLVSGASMVIVWAAAATVAAACGSDAFTGAKDGGDAESPDASDSSSFDAPTTADAAADVEADAAGDADAGCIPKGDVACDTVLTTYCQRLAQCCNGTCMPWANDGGAECRQKMGIFYPYADCPKQTAVCPIGTAQCNTDLQNLSCVTIKNVDLKMQSQNCTTFWNQFP
jgi:hypothetical protein